MRKMRKTEYIYIDDNNYILCNRYFNYDNPPSAGSLCDNCKNIPDCPVYIYRDMYLKIAEYESKKFIIEKFGRAQ